MTSYKRFLWTIAVLLLLYLVVEWNRPKPVDWTVTLAREDKNPYGGYIVYHQLKNLFPSSLIRSYRMPVYNQVNHFSSTHSAYILIDPQLTLRGDDVRELLKYARAGNYVFMASGNFSRELTDSLHFQATRRFDLVNGDSTTINFRNPRLHADKSYGFKRMTIDGYISRFDTAKTVVLGNNQFNDANFIRIPYGNGAIYIHAVPLCFSNYFMLSSNNAAYAAKALSYLPANLDTIFWDEYYKLGPDGLQNPLRFVLRNQWLRWAFRIGLVAMLLFVLFEMKRKQRIIPVIPPLRNSTLDFVQTVGNVYFNQRDNKDIAGKKINYLLAFIRSELFLPTAVLDDTFEDALVKKTGIAAHEVHELLLLINTVHNDEYVSDETLLQLNRQMDDFYNKCSG